MKSTSLKVAVVIAVVAAGIGASLWFGGGHAAEQRLAESVDRSQLVLERYFDRSDEGSRRAILDHIQYLDKLSGESGNPNRNPYSRDAITWLLRLAKLDERNKVDGASEYIREAQARCEKFEIADCSEEALRNQVDRMDASALALLRK